MSIKSPIIIENIATPNSNIKAQNNLSGLDLGLKSPNPTVDKLVNAKYVVITDILLGT